MTKVKKNHVGLLVEKNAFVDKGDGRLEFPNGMVIIDGNELRNGYKYDMESMDITEYQGQVTADHIDKLENVIAGVEGVEKQGNRVIVRAINYLVNESALGRLAYDLAVNAKVPTNFSVETYGPWPDSSDDTYYKAKLIGLSQVVVGNSKSAVLNSVVKNSLEQSKKDGLDTAELESMLESELEISVNANHTTEEDEPTESKVEKPKTKKINNKKEENDEMKFVTIKNSRDFPVTVTYKNAAGDSVSATLEAGKTIDVAEEQATAVETQINAAQAPIDETAQATAIAEAVKNALGPVQAGYDELKEAFNKLATEPSFKPAGAANSADDKKYDGLSYRELHGKQINAAWEWLKNGRIEAVQQLNEINEVNLAALKEAGKVENSLTISDFGNFVISPELLTDIVGHRNDYTALIDATNWQDTLSLEFAWLKRSGDINMQNVEFCDDDANGNLKPISEYSATPVVSKLEELAAVTPVCNAATRFLAVDLLGDVARGYRNDYDRKRAQLIVARLEQALEAHPENSVVYDVNPAVDALTDWVDVWAKIATATPNGTFIFNTQTYAEIQKRAVQAGVSGPLANIFVTGNVPTIFGRPFIVLPNDLMPSLNTAETVAIEVDGTTVTVNHAVFYFDLNNFTGRTSGGLSYDLSTEAAYEDNGTVKSAYQRNELVLRGSFFRGGAVLDDGQVSGLLANGVS